VEQVALRGEGEGRLLQCITVGKRGIYWEFFMLNPETDWTVYRGREELFHGEEKRDVALSSPERKSLDPSI